MEQEQTAETVDIISEMLLESARNPPEWVFEMGQTVRIRSTLMSDTHAIEDMLGERGTVVKRYVTSMYNEPWYHVRVDNRVEPFREHELDYRFIKGK